MTAKALAQALDMTTMGARQHLQLLEQQGDLESFDQKAPRGRPTRFWQLTEQAQRHFEDRHEELTVQLLISVKQVFGEQGLEQLIAQREADAMANYQAKLSSMAALPERLEKLAQIRSNEGYMACVESTAQGYLLLENHCPICAAATACVGFCRSELAMFQALFADLAEVSRSEHILEGARRCAYRFIARTNE
ncbi:helix-turn-helix transcriptional regulator [Motilimonas eburnea]|uniref:helix-turn-helix transcriptional regulator n=1 Tax=Motilimonas eburnea TaxID=1737488 RepID=UPI001E2F9F56|nr:transcriptional regulator [Motilimonas eburnea]MCE2572912.1 transcriptional regulator [Motilimonas eburnea]